MTLSFKYQIFISSTFRDLQEWRKGIVEQILLSDHIPSGMEGFSAGDEEDLRVIKKAIDQCDIYVVVIGSKFGSAVPETTQSFTQLEFRYARDSGKPILAFLLDNSDYEAERRALTAKDPEASLSGSLAAFRDEVKKIEDNKHRIVGFFSRADGIGGLRGQFAAALEKIVHSSTFNMPGWIRLPRGVGTNPFIKRILQPLSSFDTLSLRCTESYPETKTAMAKHFWYNYGARISSLGIRHLFFESGSTIAYVGEEFRQHLSSPHGGQNRRHWRIHTNNMLVYLEFILLEHLNIYLVPHGPPEGKYGATFGPLRLENEWPHPETNVPLSQLDSKAVKAVERLSKELLPRDECGLILATASGLEESTHNEFPGPHVGTYYNKLVKRSLLLSGHPVVLFFDESKVAPFGEKGQFIVGECHPVCDSDDPWPELCERSPLALCIGSETDERLRQIVQTLESQGPWSGGLTRKYEPNGWAVVITNAAFESLLGKRPTTLRKRTRKGK